MGPKNVNCVGFQLPQFFFLEMDNAATNLLFAFFKVSFFSITIVSVCRHFFSSMFQVFRCFLKFFQFFVCYRMFLAFRQSRKIQGENFKIKVYYAFIRFFCNEEGSQLTYILHLYSYNPLWNLRYIILGSMYIVVIHSHKGLRNDRMTGHYGQPS